VVALSSALAVVTTGASAGQDAPKPAPDPPKPPDGLAAYERLARPTERHRVLDALAGTWSVEGTTYGARGEVMKATGTSENTWILGGRFLECRLRTTVGESSVESVTTLGFDVRSGLYQAVALATIRTRMVFVQGSYYGPSRTFVLRGQDVDAATGARYVRREIIRVEAADRYVVEVFSEVPGRPPIKAFSGVYTRT
jgi:hypothetical protein